MEMTEQFSEWDFLGREGDVRLRKWGNREWAEFVKNNECDYVAGNMGAEAFWFYFAKEVGHRIDGCSLDERKVFLSECLARFYKLEVRDNGQTEI